MKIKRKKQEGMALAWILVALIIFSFIGIFITNSLLHSYKETIAYYEKSQTFEYSRAMSDVIAEKVFLQHSATTIPKSRSDAKSYFQSSSYKYLYGISYNCAILHTVYDIDEIICGKEIGTYTAKIRMTDFKHAEVIVNIKYKGHEYETTVFLECKYSYVNFSNTEPNVTPHVCNYENKKTGECMNYSYCNVCYHGFIPHWEKVNYDVKVVK